MNYGELGSLVKYYYYYYYYYGANLLTFEIYSMKKLAAWECS